MNYLGSLGYDRVQELIAWALIEYFSMMDDVTDWYPQQPITNFKIEEVETGNKNGSIDGFNDTVIQEQQTKSSMKAGPFIGAAAGLLALLLLLICFVRRRKHSEDDQVSHLKMDACDDDDTMFGEGSDDNSVPNEYNTRGIHIVGEGDSVISHWTGYTGRNSRNGQNYEVEYNDDKNKNNRLVNGLATDVHQCSSATCEICAQQRQAGAGLAFVSTGAHGESEPITVRSRSLPSDVSREYSAEDTVEL